MTVILFILYIIVLTITIMYALNLRKYEKELTQIDEANIQKNKEHLAELQRLMSDVAAVQAQVNELNREKYNLESSQRTELNKLNTIKAQVADIQLNSENMAKESFSRYVDILEQEMSKIEQEYDNYTEKLKASYQITQSDILAEIEECKAELAFLKETKAATIAAQIKEQEIKDKLSFYCLQIGKNDLNDIQVLDNIKIKLNNQRILSMLIWSTFFQKNMTSLCNNILGAKTVCGIYKITNQKNEKCYIGQSVDVSRRWKDHAKCGLGIDTPQGNKLYKDMQDFGIWNFSWELLEECSKEQLNEKEKYYIELYQSKEYGYNTLKGNN